MGYACELLRDIYDNLSIGASGTGGLTSARTGAHIKYKE